MADRDTTDVARLRECLLANAPRETRTPTDHTVHKGRSRSLLIPNVKKGEGLKVEVAGVSAAGHRGPTAVGHLKGSMHVGSHKHKHKHHGKHKSQKAAIAR
jgi:hypothetical protein